MHACKFNNSYHGTWTASLYRNRPPPVVAEGESAQKGWGKPWACERPWCWPPAGPRGGLPRHHRSQHWTPGYVGVCVCVCVSVCMYAYGTLWVNIHVIGHVYIHVVISKCIGTCTYTHMHEIVHIHACAYMYTSYIECTPCTNRGTLHPRKYTINLKLAVSNLPHNSCQWVWP